MIRLLFGLALLLAFNFTSYGEPKDENMLTTTTTNASSFTTVMHTVTGVITDEEGVTLPGANILVKGTSRGAVSDVNGRYTIEAPQPDATLVFSFIGYITQEVDLEGRTEVNVTLSPEFGMLEEVMVVGYGIQRKESVVGAISQAKGEELQRTSLTNLGQALTGLVPGVNTIQVQGRPGDDDPIILIRGQSTWNNAQPLVLVDGIERRMSDVDMSDVETVSVLKDASATAVFGVKGAEGVILITTKRGAEGKTRFEFSSNVGMKFLARMPGRLDSYDAYMYQNAGIERELPTQEDTWRYFMPMDIVNRYRYHLTPEDQYIFPNVDWTDAMTRDFGLSQRYNLNVTGGSNFAKYFASLAYTKEGDILNSGQQVGLPYDSQYSYERYNYRTNLDFNITPTTVFTTNLSGHLGVRNGTFVNHEFDLWRAFYYTPSGVFPVKHADGTWGYTQLNTQINNPVRLLNQSGARRDLTTQVNTDFILKQELDFITPGLNTQVLFSFDNAMFSTSGVQGSSLLSKYIDPFTGLVSYNPIRGRNEYDYNLQPSNFFAESMEVNRTNRRLYYQFQANYARTFGSHEVGATGVMNREEFASGAMFPRYREDWIGRVTYGFDRRYLFEANAAYNGSERFGEGFRFGFFPSVALGWVLSNENFFNVDWVDNLKFRYSHGKVGNDNFAAPRWAYATQWALADYRTRFGPFAEWSPYTRHLESVVGNPFLQWETSLKQNLGIELEVLRSRLSFNVELFQDNRDNIFVSASQRNVPDYFGANPVSANIGQTMSRGFEFEMRYNDRFFREFDFWTTFSFTHAKDRIVYREDPDLLPDYLKQEGFQIGQTRTQMSAGYITNWDDVYASVKGDANNQYRLPGDLNIIDFNGDGIINTFDAAPFGYPSRPQNIYNFASGFDYRGVSFMIQFYGVFNSTRFFSFANTTGQPTAPNVYEYMNDYWTSTNPDPRYKGPRSGTESYIGELHWFDGSYLRLRNVELAYTYRQPWLNNYGISSMRIFVSGHNLFFWSKLPEDREQSVETRGGGTQQLYPNLLRATMGLNISF